MSKNLRITEISLREIANNILNGNYGIPRFQRDFVWKSSDISSVGDSIIRGYPISALLMISAESNLKIGYSPLKTEGSIITKELSNIQYLLDGQQRITSIAKIFCNMDDKRIYYFDLLSILNEYYPEDDIVLTNYNKNDLPKEEFCRFFHKPISKEIPPTKFNNRYISAQTILSGDTYGMIEGFLETIKDITNDKRKKYYQTLNSMIGDIPNYGIPLTTISNDANLDLICRVFEKINSTGQKLTTFDLINAKSFTSEKGNSHGGIINYIKNDLLENKLAKNDLKKVYGSFLKYECSSDNFSKIERIMRILFLSSLISENKKNLLMTNFAMLNKSPDFWFDLWDERKNDIFQFFNWLEKEKIVGLSPDAFFEYMGAIFISKPKLLNTRIFTDFVKRKALSLGISALQFSRADVEDVNNIITSGDKILNSSEFDKYKHVLSITNANLDSDAIFKLKKGNQAYNVAVHIMAYEKSGLFNTDLTNHNIKDVFDEHHIIPKQQYKDKNLENDVFNSIANITLLNPDSNRTEIKGKKPADYFINLKSVLGERTFNYVCEQNLINLNLLNEDDYESFLIERSENLAEYLNKYFLNK